MWPRNSVACTRKSRRNSPQRSTAGVATLPNSQEVHSRYPEAAERLLQAERLEHESWQLVGQIGESEDDAKKQRLTSALRQNLNEIFDAKLIERSLEVRELENEIKELNVLISRRESMKDSIVERRLAEMIAEADEASRWW